MDKIVHFNIRISGKVQGVFFRANAQNQAIELKLVGIVRNEPEGSVYVEVEGPQEKIQQFLAWCHHGDLPARVDNCIFEEAKEVGYKEFEILR
jgi:acylphosphatase